MEADPDDGDDPDAKFFLWTDGAADQEFGSILEPFNAGSTKTEGVGNRQRLNFAGGNQLEMKSFEVGVEQVFPVGRN